VNCAVVRPPITYVNLYQQVGRRSFCVFDEYVKIPGFIEYAGVEQFVFGIITAATPVSSNQIQVRKFILWIPVEILCSMSTMRLMLLSQVVALSGEPAV